MSDDKRGFRSRTSGGRRRACVLCRDRKVRCDGYQPSCQRCITAGETCVYATPSKQSKAEMANTINELREKLKEVANQQNTSPKQQQQQQQQFAPIVSSDIFSTVPSDSTSSHSSITMSWSSNLVDDFQTPTSSSITTNPSSNLVDEIQVHTTSGGFRQPPSQTDDACDMMGYDMPTTDITTNVCTALVDFNSSSGLSGNGLAAPFAPMTAADSLMDTDGHQYACQFGQSLPGSGTSTPSSRLPSLRDIRAAGQQRPRSSEATEQILRNFVEDISSIMAAQYNIIGIADTVAHYCSYFKNEQNAGQSSCGSLPDLLESHQQSSPAHFLAVLEQRMREVGEIASDQVLKQTVRSLKGLAAQGILPRKASDLEDEQMRQARRSFEFFDERYNIEQPLAEQTDVLQKHNAPSSSS